MVLASGCPKTPTTPQWSLSLSNMPAPTPGRGSTVPERTYSGTFSLTRQRAVPCLAVAARSGRISARGEPSRTSVRSPDRAGARDSLRGPRLERTAPAFRERLGAAVTPVLRCFLVLAGLLACLRVAFLLR